MSESVDDLFAELNAEFGKKDKTPGQRKAEYDEAERARKADRIRLLHEAKKKLADGTFKNVADYQLFKHMVESADIAKQMDWRPSWIPQARVTYCVKQHCDRCLNTVSFIGGEFIRFRAREGKAVIVKRADWFPELFLTGWWNEKELPDLVEEQYQVVHRCPACINLERTVDTLWAGVGKPEGETVSIALDAPQQPKPLQAIAQLSGQQLKQMIGREFGVKFKPTKSDEIEIEID